MPNQTHTQTNRRHRPFFRHPLFYIILIVILTVGVIFATKHFSAPSVEEPSPTSTQSTPAQTPPASDPTSSSDPSAIASNPSASTDSKTPTQYDGTNPNQNTTLTGSLTAARFSGDNLVIRVNIDQYLSAGTCVLTLASGANHIEKTAPIVPSASTSTCEGFDLSAADLTDLSRPFNISITFTSDDKTGIVEGIVE